MQSEGLTSMDRDHMSEDMVHACNAAEELRQLLVTSTELLSEQDALLLELAAKAEKSVEDSKVCIYSATRT